MSPETIKQFRKTKGWSQAELAGVLGVDQATVSRIENGSEPSGPVALLLAQLLGLPAERAA